MYMIMHLFKENYLQDILLALTESGIEDTVVLSGETLGHKLIYDIPLFAGFKQSYGSKRSFAHIIFGFADKEQIDDALLEMKRAGIDFVGKDIGSIALIPVEHKILAE